MLMDAASELPVQERTHASQRHIMYLMSSCMAAKLMSLASTAQTVSCQVNCI